jgi:hypothetical protein
VCESGVCQRPVRDSHRALSRFDTPIVCARLSPTAAARPGVCVCPCSGTLSAPLQEGDTVLFISTLHGG